MKRIVIFSSELAGLIGKNRYVSKGEALEKLMCRILNIPNKEETLQSSLNSRQKDIIYEGVGKSESGQQVVTNVTQIKKKIQDLPNVSESDKEELFKFAQKLHYTTHGSKAEDSIKKSVEIQKSIEILKDDVFRKRHLFDVGEYNVFIGGKCDGIAQLEGRETIVEIKNRINRLFRTIPDYEKVQLYSYMYIYKLENGLLIENYNHEKNMIPCRFDSSEWNNYSEELKKVLSNIDLNK
jgi:hypothetical protein